MDPAHAVLQIPEDRRRSPTWLGRELVWFGRASAWALLGSAIVSYVYLFLLGPSLLEGSDTPARSYSWTEYVLAPFVTLLNPFGLVLCVLWAALSLIPARLFVRHRRLGRCTLFASAVVSAWILLSDQMFLHLLSIFGFLMSALPFGVLCIALVVCRFWPGSYFRLRSTVSPG